MAKDGYYMGYAIGKDLTAWLNAKAPLVVGEINSMDWFISADVTHTKPKTIEVNPMTSGHVPKRITVGRDLGKITANYFLQTGILTYVVMGASTAVGAGVMRTITKDLNETPIKLGFHLEKEGTTANRRKDALGIVPNNLNIYVSEQQPIAKQTYTGEFAFTGDGGNLAQPNALVQATYLPYTWYNYRSASGTSEFLYHGGAINVEPIGLNLNFGWTGSKFGGYDELGYPANGLYTPPFWVKVTLECLRKDAGGTDIETISDLDHASYAGDLNFIADFYQSATRYLLFDFDDMYVDPKSFVETFISDGDWFDGVKFDLIFRNETSSLISKEINALDDTYYTNP